MIFYLFALSKAPTLPYFYEGNENEKIALVSFTYTALAPLSFSARHMAG